MARVLFAWECGGGLHHLANVGMLARALAPGEHVLGAALRDLDNAPAFLSGVALQYYQAPFQQGDPSPAIERYEAYVHVLRACGFGALAGLQIRLSAWLGVFSAFRPDVLVCDHAPTALLASRVSNPRRLVVGAGFCVPPAATPLGLLPDVALGAEVVARLEAQEADLLGVANEALRAFGGRRLERLSDLYADADGCHLLTLPEVDPYGPREAPAYLGTWAGPPRRAPEWPPGAGPRVLAYLSAHSCPPQLVEALRRSGARALVLCGAGTAAERAAWAAPEEGSLRVQSRLVDLAKASQECDLFVSHGSHSSVCQTLMRGVPQLLVPVYREQELTAWRVAALGAGIVAPLATAAFDEAVERALGDSSLRAGARRVAEAHRDFDPERAAERFRAGIVRLLV